MPLASSFARIARFALLLLAAFASAVAWPRPARAGGEPMTSALALEVEVDEAELREAIVDAIVAEFERIGGERGLELVAAGTDAAELHVEVRVWEPEPGAVVLDTRVRLDDQTLAEQVDLVCMGCDVAEVADASLSPLPDAITQAHATRAEASAAQVTPTASDLPTDVQPRRAWQARRLGPVGITGVAASGIGFAATIVGVVALDQATRNPVGPEAGPRPQPRTLGLGLVGAGIGVMVVGQVLLALDLGPLRDRQARHGARRARRAGLELGFELGRGGRAGVATLRGEF